MKHTEYTCIDVAIALPLKEPFTYKISKSLASPSLIGRRVLVPFRTRMVIGYVVRLHADNHERDLSRIKEIVEIIDDKAVLDETMLALTRWMSEFYLCSWGLAIDNALPRYLKTKRQNFAAIRLRGTKASRKALSSKARFELTREQHTALARLEKALATHTGERFLLFGITGSGKTEVYIRAIERALQAGQSAICLFPEIALTKHLEDYFLTRFQDKLAIMHSRLTHQEQFRMWREIRQGRRTVVIGPRSALFAPLMNLGLIVIDEEHENTYKQNEIPRYHARTVAYERARLTGAVVVMGGATPSVETMYAAEKGDIHLLHLKKRIVDRPLPEVTTIDMKSEVRNNVISIIANYLKRAIERSLSADEGVLLFLNRRGFATTVSCTHCGHIIECARCRLALTYHQSMRKLLCHYCNRVDPYPEECPECSRSSLRFSGIGTEKIESYIARLFPQARIERLDTDRVRKKGEHERILTAFKERKIDILIGTQMITKGFDFPHVTLVGVINADTVLTLPDFRSSERTFQLLTQVAGRAGRGHKKGEVVIQTFTPSHYAIKAAEKHDYAAFYQEEIKQRAELKYPPFSNLINIIIRGRNEKRVRESASDFAYALKDNLRAFSSDLLGPAPLPFYRLHGYYRWHVMIKGQVCPELLAHVKSTVERFRKSKSIQFACDVEPVNIL